MYCLIVNTAEMFRSSDINTVVSSDPGFLIPVPFQLENIYPSFAIAIANEGYMFSNWNGTGIRNPGSLDTTVLMSEERNISAVFTIKQYILSLPATEGGEVDGGGIYNHGSEVEISATPATGYSFKKWNGGNPDNPTSSLATIILTEDTNITASFDRIVYTLQL